MKRPIDRMRESAGTMELSPPDDPSPIKEMIKIDGHLHIVKGRGIYRVSLADEIDPERTNPEIPNSYQRVLQYGADDEIVGKTLLTAKNLLNPTFLPKCIDCEEAIRLSFDALKDIAGMAGTKNVLSQQQNELIEHAVERTPPRGGLSLPTISNLRGLCKDFIQQADHSIQSLYQLAALFYGRRKGWFEGITEQISRERGSDDELAKFFEDATIFFKAVRNIRNCVEHPKPDQRIIVLDFELLPSGEISPPTIEVVHPQVDQPKILVTTFMSLVTDRVCLFHELAIAHLCSANAQSVAGFQPIVAEQPLDQRRSQHVRFYYQHSRGAFVAPE